MTPSPLRLTPALTPTTGLSRCRFVVWVGLAAAITAVGLASPAQADDWVQDGGAASPSVTYFGFDLWNGTPWVAYTDGATEQVSVRYLCGSTWVQAGGSLNNNTGNRAFSVSLALIQGTPYATWHESNDSAPYNDSVFVKRYSGGIWSAVGTPLNVNVNEHAWNPRITSVGTVPYVAWSENNETWDLQVRVKHWNGSGWISDGGPLNVDTNQSGRNPDITSDGTRPWVAWEEYDSNRGASQIYVKYLVGSSWAPAGSSANQDANADAYNPSVLVDNGTAYVGFYEYSETYEAQQTYVTQLVGGSWWAMGEALNSNRNVSSYQPTLGVYNGTVGAAFYETNAGDNGRDGWVKTFSGTWNAVGSTLNVMNPSWVYYPILKMSGSTPYVGFRDNAVYVKHLAPPTPTASSTGTPTSTRTYTSTATPTRTMTPTSPPTRTTTPTPSRTRTITPTATASCTRTSTPTSTVTPTATVTLTATRSVTYTTTATVTPTSTTTGTATITLTATPSATPTVSPTLTITRTRTITPTASITPTQSVTSTVYVIGAQRVVTYPSPARGNTVWFYYRVDGPAEVEIEIFNVAGERVATLRDQPPQAGHIRTAWDIRDVAPGVYMYRARITQGGRVWESLLQKVVVVKP